MAELNLSSATTTDFTAEVPNFIVSQKALDAANPVSDETYYYFSEANQKFGYYFTIPEIFSAANALATWSVGRGWVCENIQLKQELEHLRGMGKDTFEQLMWNHEVVKLIVGDA